MSIIVRQYGLLDPLNWGDDCFEHLYLQNKFWNRLVEIERDNRSKYRTIVGSDEDVAPIQATIDIHKAMISELADQRNQLRIQYRKKIGTHTEPLDIAIKAAKIKLRELSAKAKESRIVAKERIQAAGSTFKILEEERRQSVKDGYNDSGLWWGNYNAVLESYKSARNRAMKEGAELRFHHFDGSGRFTCQIMGGMSTEKLLSGRHNVAQVKLLSRGEFAQLLKNNTSAIQNQSVGSRRDKREYGILTITIYTGEDEQGKKTRRTLDFPIIMHRPLPDGATLKTLSVNRKKVGTDYRWTVTFTFSNETDEIASPVQTNICGINFGWKQVEGGLRVATITDNIETRHIVLPQVIVDKLAHSEYLQSRVDIATNENYAWMLEKMVAPPDNLKEDIAILRRSKKPHPAKFARLVIKWRNECPDFEPLTLAIAEKMRKRVKRLSQEHHHLRDKTQRRRLEFYRNEAKKIADKYSLIRTDKIDLRQMALLEKGDGTPNKLADIARYHRKVAALSEFREWIGKQSLKVSGKVEIIEMESTRTCYSCGGGMKRSGGKSLKCRECGIVVDQDENASANLLRAGV